MVGRNPIPGNLRPVHREIRRNGHGNSNGKKTKERKEEYKEVDD